MIQDMATHAFVLLTFLPALAAAGCALSMLIPMVGIDGRRHLEDGSVTKGLFWSGVSGGLFIMSLGFWNYVNF